MHPRPWPSSGTDRGYDPVNDALFVLGLRSGKTGVPGLGLGYESYGGSTKSGRLHATLPCYVANYVQRTQAAVNAIVSG